MKKMFSFLFVPTLAAILALTACSNSDQLTDPGETLAGEEKLTLEEEFGGFDTSDEPVAFGESDMLDAFPEDEDAGDAYAEDAQVVAALSATDLSDSTKIKAYFLRITYGLLEGDSTATEVVDWSGSAEVSKGTLVVLKTIRFERNDAIKFPRDSRKIVEFISQTKNHFDGLVLAIIDNDSTDEEGTFSFNAGGYTKVLTFSELDSLELLEPVGSGGHEVSILARSKEYTPFAGGFLAGRWIKTARHGGHFRGRWINSIGTNAGHLKGIWGITRAGNKVFKGKYISLNGEFRGLLAGEWDYEDDEKGGFFRGRWVDRAHETVGRLRGKFKTGRAGDGRGFFHGRYRVHKRDDTGD
ncbi:MAG: hypothetical protein ACE5IY_06280 [bacterium]